MWVSFKSHGEGLLFETRDSLATITLDRPKALNSLTLDLIRSFKEKLIEWENNPRVKVILVKGGGGKAFCSGGDIVSITKSAKNGGSIHKEFFTEEYSLNHLISILKTPYISIYNGITMGGGVGISVHGRYRIATNVSTFAMPETAIGFHPDVGGSFFLPRLSGHLGMFLALSGYRLKGRDICHSGIATHYMHLDEISRLEYQLSQIRDYNEVSSILEVLNISPLDERCIINARLQLINYAFSADTVEQIIERLSIQNDKWANSIRKLLILMSPIALKVTHKSLNTGAKLTLKNCLRMECNISNRFLRTNDFYEGVRAVLLEKDKMPKWKPSTLASVTNDIVDSFFLESGGSLLSFNSAD